MKKVFGIILIIVGVITLARIGHLTGFEAIGGFFGVSLVTFIPAFLLLRNKREKNSKESFKLMDETYWYLYKNIYPEKANDIEKLTGLNFSSLRSVDAKQKIASLERWASNLNCTIPDLKKEFFLSIEQNFTFEELDIFIKQTGDEQIKEAKQFNISSENTITSFMVKWAKEYIKEKLVNLNSLEENYRSKSSVTTTTFNNDEILDTFINYFAESESEEDAKELFLGYITEKQNSPFMKNTILEKIREKFHNEAKSYISDNKNMNPYMLELSLNKHIINLMESFKDNSDLFSLTAMTKSEYDKAIANIANETTDKFFEKNNKSYFTPHLSDH